MKDNAAKTWDLKNHLDGMHYAFTSVGCALCERDKLLTDMACILKDSRIISLKKLPEETAEKIEDVLEAYEKLKAAR